MFCVVRSQAQALDEEKANAKAKANAEARANAEAELKLFKDILERYRRGQNHKTCTLNRTTRNYSASNPVPLDVKEYVPENALRCVTKFQTLECGRQSKGIGLDRLENQPGLKIINGNMQVSWQVFFTFSDTKRY